MFNKILSKLFPVYDEGQSIPHKLSVVRREVPEDRMCSVLLIIPSPRVYTKGVYSTDTFMYHPNARVKNVYMFRVRFPSSNSILFTRKRIESIVHTNSKGHNA